MDGKVWKWIKQIKTDENKWETGKKKEIIYRKGYKLIKMGKKDEKNEIQCAFWKFIRMDEQVWKWIK